MRNPFRLMYVRFSDYRSNIHIRRGKRILSRARSDVDRLNDFVDQLAEHYGPTFYQQLGRYCIRYEKAHFEFDRAFVIVASTCSALVLIPGLTGIIFGLIKMDSNASSIGASTAFVVLLFFRRINNGVTESGDRVRTYFYLRILLFLIALSAIAATYRSERNEWTHGVFQFFLGWAFVLLSYGAMAAVLLLLLALLVLLPPIKRYRLSADQRIFRDVCELLRLSSNIACELPKRKQALRLIEKIATRLESDIPRSLGIDPENVSDLSMKRFRRSASHIRSLKVWVSFPQLSTSTQLRQELVTILGAAVTHMYHYLAAAGEDPVRETVRMKWYHRALGAIRQIAVAAIPIGGLLLLQFLGVQLIDQIKTSWTIGGVAWAAVVLITTLDPSYKDKVGAAKDLAGLIAPKGKAE